MPSGSEFGNVEAGAVVAPCPLAQPPPPTRSHWIEIELLGEDGEGIPGEEYSLRLPDGGYAVGYLDDSGAARVENITQPGWTEVRFPRLDSSAWHGLPEPAENIVAGAGAAHTHVVVQGDTLIRLGEIYGMAPDTIWADAGNSGLRARRKDSNELLPGDILVVPPKRERVARRETDARHRFRRPGVPARMRLQVLYGGRPVVDAKYLLAMEDRVARGVTSAAGVVDVVVNPLAQRGVLTVAPNENSPLISADIRFGNLDPLNSRPGVARRLWNLGFWRESGEEIGRLRRALEGFQRAFGLPITGVQDNETLALLEQLHDSATIWRNRE